MCELRELATEGRKGNGKTWIWNVLSRSAVEFQAAECEMRPAQGSACGRDCGACEVVGKTQLKED
jgi:hypothetical protein